MRYGMLALVAGAVGLAAGCDLRVEGDEGELFFEYDAEGLHSFRRAVAVGSRADVAVSLDEEGDEPAEVSAVTFEVPDVFDLIETEGHRFTLEGLEVGETRVTVDAADRSDRITMEAAAVASVELRVPNPFTVNDGASVAFLEGGTARVPATLEDEGGSRLTGYGLPGFTADPEAAATFAGFETQDPNFLHVTFAEAGPVALDHEHLEAPFEVEVVPTSEVASLSWTDFGTTGDGISVGESTLLLLVAMLDDEETRLYGTDGAAALEVTPSEVCALAHSRLWGDSTWELEGLSAGDCTVEATLGEETAIYEVTVTE